jgi:hypothetical protein
MKCVLQNAECGIEQEKELTLWVGVLIVKIAHDEYVAANYIPPCFCSSDPEHLPLWGGWEVHRGLIVPELPLQTQLHHFS